MATKQKPKPAPKRSTASDVGPSKADEARWRAESDVRTMQTFAELKADPKRLRAAEALIKEQLKVIQSVKGNTK